MWNSEGRVSSITEGASATKFLYDADGKLLIKRDPTETVLYVDKTKAHLSASTGEVTGTRYYDFNGKTVGVAKNSSSFEYLITDQHDTLVVTINSPTQDVLRRRETRSASTAGPRLDGRRSPRALWAVSQTTQTVS